MKVLYWIDDTHDAGKPPKPTVQKRLEQGLRVKLRIAAITNRKQFDELLCDFLNKSTYGVIMDYELSKVGENNRVAYGNTWASEIRAINPLVPVIGISHESEINIPKLRLESFLAFFPRDQLMGAHPPLQDISALLSGYYRISRIIKGKSTTSGTERMVGLVRPPTEVTELVKAAVPPALRGSWDEETPHTAGRWLWHEFQGLPGFLFDELGLATHLGLRVNGLRRIITQFSRARYQGAFSSDGRPRWWVHLTRGVVENILDQKIVGALSTARVQLLNALSIKSSDHDTVLSHPHGRKTRGAIPDCVAYGDDQKEEDYRVQALFEDTYVDDRDANPAFGFEPRRIYRPSISHEEKN